MMIISKKPKQIIGAVMAICIVAALIMIGVILFRPTPLIPKAITKQLSIVIYEPTSPWTVATKDISYL
jgi:hypothetical protein